MTWLRRSHLIAVSVLVLAATPATAGSAVNPRAKLVGSWKAVSIVLVDGSGKTVGQPYGDHPAGKLTYTPTGHVWALVSKANAPRDDPANAQWYTGTFTVNPKKHTVIHHVQYSTVAGWEGTDLVRRYSFKGRQTLILTAAAGNDRLVLTWRRE